MKYIKYSRSIIYTNFLTLVYKSQVGHIGSCLSVMDILISLYLHVKKKEDMILLSKGHAAPALYVVLHACGLLSNNQLDTFHNNGSKLPVHVPHDLMQNDVPFSLGSLGHGLSLSAGIAHARRLQGKKGRVYCVMSDGECNEGQVWEAAQYAVQYKLNNLVALIDVNNIQAFGKTKQVLGEITKEKWRSFGWNTYECNGHSIKDIVSTIKKSKSSSKKPTVLICRTIKGFGLSFFEHTLKSHYLHLSEKQYLKGLQEFQSL